MAATTGQLGLVTPTQGTLSGTWGDTVNNGITEYTNIAIAGTLSFAGDGAITLANTTGDASATNIGSTTAQYMVIRVTGTLTTAKVITGPSYSKLYLVDNAATGGIVTFKASGQTGVSIAVGESAFVYYNGTDYIKVASDLITALSGTLGVANGGTGLTSLTAGYIPFGAGTSAYGNSANLFWDSASAYLGVGTSSPTARLQINGTTDATQRIVVNGTGNVSSLKLQYNGTEVVQLQNYQSTEVQFGTTSSAYLALVTNNTEKARLDTAGYLSGVWADDVSALGNSGTAKTITCTAGGVFTATLTGNCTFTLASPSTTTANTGTSITLILTNDATPSRTVAWAGGTFKFPGGAASLSRTTTANAVDVWVFFTPDGGTTWYGNIAMKNMTT